MFIKKPYFSPQVWNVSLTTFNNYCRKNVDGKDQLLLFFKLIVILSCFYGQCGDFFLFLSRLLLSNLGTLPTTTGRFSNFQWQMKTTDVMILEQFSPAFNAEIQQQAYSKCLNLILIHPHTLPVWIQGIKSNYLGLRQNEKKISISWLSKTKTSYPKLQQMPSLFTSSNALLNLESVKY